MSRRGAKKGVSGASTSVAPRSKRSRNVSMHDLPWPMTDKMIERYATLSTRKIVPTKYIDVDTLDRLELSDRVQYYLTNVSWVKFAALRPPTYKELTLEFLCSLECSLYKGKHEDLGIVTFRMLGNYFRIHVDDVDNMLGFTTYGTKGVSHGESVGELWNRLTGQLEYNPSQSKATCIPDPALRYLHRFITGSIFGRGLSLGTCCKPDLYILHAMFTGEDINTGYWLLDHMLRVRQSSRGDICIGGIVTMLAQQLGLELDESQLTRVEGKSGIDMEILLNMRMVKKVQGNFILIGSEHNQGGESDEEGEDTFMEHSDDEEQAAPPSVPFQPDPESSSQPTQASMNMILEKLEQMRVESRRQYAQLEKRQTRQWTQANQRIDSLEKKIDYYFGADEETEDDD